MRKSWLPRACLPVIHPFVCAYRRWREGGQGWRISLAGMTDVNRCALAVQVRSDAPTPPRHPSFRRGRGRRGAGNAANPRAAGTRHPGQPDDPVPDGGPGGAGRGAIARGQALSARQPGQHAGHQVSAPPLARPAAGGSVRPGPRRAQRDRPSAIRAPVRAVAVSRLPPPWRAPAADPVSPLGRAQAEPGR